MEYFLKEDVEALDRKIEEAKAEIDKALGEIGDSCQQGAETSHDNPGYEEGQRKATMWSNQLRQLLSIRRVATLIDPPPPISNDGRVKIGHLVTIKDLLVGEEKQFRLGSAMISGDEKNRVSYKSPIGQALFGATIGDILEPTLGGKKQKWLVLNTQ